MPSFFHLDWEGAWVCCRVRSADRHLLIDRSIDFLLLSAGAVVERGHTCSHSEYRAFLRRCLLLAPKSLWAQNGEEEDDSGDHEAAMAMAVAMDGGAGLPSRRWEGLRLRVECGERLVLTLA